MAFWRLLPTARHFEPRSLRPRALLRDLRQLLRDPGLPWLFLVAFLLMGVFIAFYNYLGFRLSLAPFELGQTAIGALFLLYGLGTWSSAVSGRLVDRHGPWRVALAMTGLMAVGLLLSLPMNLPVLIVGAALFTFGFFGAHATASGWVGARAQSRRAFASALYLTSYYLGGSIPPLVAGIVWDHVRDLENIMTSLVQLIAAAHAHAHTESEGDLEGIMATMEGEPVYEFYPAGRCFRGVVNTRRYYQHFVDDFQRRITGYELLSESIGREGVAQEYTIHLTLPGAAEPSAHRIMAILTFGERGITGERMYGDEALFRAMLGPLWQETESLADKQ